MVKVALLVVMCIAAVGVMLTPNAEAIISCGQVVERLTPCIEYVREGGVLPTSCCSGIKTRNGEAATTPDHQAACNCIKSTAATISDINLDLAATLPTKCGVNLPYKISPSIDYSTKIYEVTYAWQQDAANKTSTIA